MSKAMECFFNFASTITRSPSYLIGVLFGFFIDEWEMVKNDEKKSKSVEIECITKTLQKYFKIALISNVVLIPAILRILNEFIEDRYVLFVFDSFSKLSTSTTFGLFIAILHCGSFKSANDFLSLNIWTPIAKLCYCLFLVSPSIQLLRITENLTLENFDILKIVRIIEIFNVIFFIIELF